MNTINLPMEDASNPLGKVKVTLGWDTSRKGGWTSAADDNVDCDLSAFLFSNGKLRNADDVIYFANTLHNSHAASHSGDSLNGYKAGGDAKDDETIEVDLGALPERYDEILFTVSIYAAGERNQTFRDARNAFFRAYDQTGRLLCFINLTREFADKAALKAARLYREGAEWKFRTDKIPLDIESGGVSQVAKALRDFQK